MSSAGKRAWSTSASCTPGTISCTSDKSRVFAAPSPDACDVRAGASPATSVRGVHHRKQRRPARRRAVPRHLRGQDGVVTTAAMHYRDGPLPLGASSSFARDPVFLDAARGGLALGGAPTAAAGLTTSTDRRNITAAHRERPFDRGDLGSEFRDAIDRALAGELVELAIR